jgi:hypothetical protein
MPWTIRLPKIIIFPHENQRTIEILKTDHEWEETQAHGAQRLTFSRAKKEGQTEAERARENFRDSYEEGQRNGEMRLKNVRNVEIWFERKVKSVGVADGIRSLNSKPGSQRRNVVEKWKPTAGTWAQMQ